ncbi:hypothetical protein MKZ02_19540 [Pseudobacillus sp. FSL P4-0506]|uniref:hypothetical protein n=1 Tax=Pseudobacillus sp. FSL P4-0506 TaxID=2921576 RepID=UPI0030F9C56A
MKATNNTSIETKKKPAAVSSEEKDPSSRKDWEELMDKHRPTFKRVGGRMRRK